MAYVGDGPTVSNKYCAAYGSTVLAVMVTVALLGPICAIS